MCTGLLPPGANSIAVKILIIIITENKSTDVVIQQHSRKLLMVDTLMSETCWAYKKWNKIVSDMKLVFHSSNITMMQVPINIRNISLCFSSALCRHMLQGFLYVVLFVVTVGYVRYVDNDWKWKCRKTRKKGNCRVSSSLHMSVLYCCSHLRSFSSRFNLCLNLCLSHSIFKESPRTSTAQNSIS